MNMKDRGNDYWFNKHDISRKIVGILSLYVYSCKTMKAPIY
jgi:hypothetical protein